MSPEQEGDFHTRGIDKLYELGSVNNEEALVALMREVFLLVVECNERGSTEFWGWIGRFCIGIQRMRGLSYPLPNVPPSPPNRKKGNQELADWLFKRTTNLYQHIEEGSRLKGDQRIECDNQFVEDCRKLAELAKCYLGEK